MIVAVFLGSSDLSTWRRSTSKVCLIVVPLVLSIPRYTCYTIRDTPDLDLRQVPCEPQPGKQGPQYAWKYSQRECASYRASNIGKRSCV